MEQNGNHCRNNKAAADKTKLTIFVASNQTDFEVTTKTWLHLEN